MLVWVPGFLLAAVRERLDFSVISLVCMWRFFYNPLSAYGEILNVSLLFYWL